MMDGVTRAAIVIAALMGTVSICCVLLVLHSLALKVNKIEKVVKELNPGADL